MFHFTYKTTNLVNGKYYLGKHSTVCLEDGYLGSGKSINRAIKKYGKKQFERTILEFFETKKEAFQAEKLLVNEEEVKNKNCYNLKIGGDGGFDHINGDDHQTYILKGLKTNKLKDEALKKEENKRKSNPGNKNGMYGVKRCGEKNPMWNRKHSKMSIEKMRKIKKGTIVVKDLNENIIGSVSIDHPKYVSGEYVVISTGTKRSEEFKKKRSIEWKNRGIKPPSSKGLLWWTNGNERKRSIECPGLEWHRGRK